MNHSRHILAIGACLLSWLLLTMISTGVDAQDWTRFRGPNGSGVNADSVAPPETWSPTENMKWKTELPGPGASCPIVIGDRIFLTCYSGYGESRENVGDPDDLKRHVVCVNRADGTIAWQKTIEPILPEDLFRGAGVPEHGYASHTPVTDGENLYVFLGKSGVYAFGFEGNELWHKSVGTDSDVKKWGSAASPILHEDVLIVPAIAESRTVYGLDKKTGDVIWTQDNDGGIDSSWGTPILFETSDGRIDIVMGVPEQIIGLNPEDGSIRWHCNDVPSDSFYSSVIEDDGIIYASVGSMRGGGSIAVRGGGEGDVTDTHVLWKGKTRNSYGTPVIHGDKMYLVNRGVITAIDTGTGDEGEKIRLNSSASTGSDRGGNPGAGKGKRDGKGASRGGRRRGRGGMGGDYASPIIANDRLYFVKRSGETFVFDAKSLEEIAVNKVTEEREEFSATPAISDGQIFLRSNKYLYCVEAG